MQLSVSSILTIIREYDKSSCSIKALIDFTLNKHNPMYDMFVIQLERQLFIILLIKRNNFKRTTRLNKHDFIVSIIYTI